MGANTSKISISPATEAAQPVAVASPLRPDAWADLDHHLAGSSLIRTKERIQCLCEGGHQCVSEDPSCQQTPSAFQGLHCSWVTPQVLAMARPWQEHLIRYDIAQGLRAAGIGMVLNLQEVGEHAHCGRGVLPSSGFSYDPETFMANSIGVYNFSWRDMGVPTLHKMTDIVQVMVHVTEEDKRKVAVHCHAGLGRTGLAIACYLVFLGDCDAHEAVLKVRLGRPGALQTRQQEHFVEVFQMYITHLRCVFQTAQTVTPNCLLAGALQGPPSAAVQAASKLQGTSSAQSALSGKAEPDVVGAGVSGAAKGAVAATDVRPIAAWTEQPDATAAPVCSTSGSFVDSAAMSGDLDASAPPFPAGSQKQLLSAPAEHRHGMFRVPWLIARGGKGAAQVHASEPARSSASKSDVLWSEDGFIKAGSRHNMRRGQIYRASPPAHLQEALTRQRRLLHGQELRNYWNLPKVVDKIAGALEHAAQGSVSQEASGQRAAGASEHLWDHENTASCATTQLVDIAAHSAAESVITAAAAAIALEVNRGEWGSLTAASPAVLMQLLQRWFQGFQDPVLSASQQKALLSMLGSHAISSDACDSVRDAAAQPPADADSCKHVYQHAAVFECLSVPQRALIARLVTCFRLIEGTQATASNSSCLMQWVAGALTGSAMHAGVSTETLSEGQIALASLLGQCDVRLLVPMTNSQRQAAAEASTMASQLQSTGAAVSEHGSSVAAVSMPDESAVDAGGRISLWAAEGESHVPGKPDLIADDTANKAQPDNGWDYSDQGCLWLHTRLAKSMFTKFVVQSGRTAAAAQ